MKAGDAKFMAILGMDRFALSESDRLPCNDDILIKTAFDVHFNTAGVICIDDFMLELAGFKGAAKFAVDPGE